MPRKNAKPAPPSTSAEARRRRKGKPPSASRTEMAEVVLPNNANLLGNVLGGHVMHLIDITGAIAANRHSCSHVVTASVDYIDFRNPIKVGDLIILKSEVNRAFHTSIEVGVEVFSENVRTGKRTHTSSAFVTFVAIDENDKPHLVPPVVPRTAAERRRFREAGIRRRIRLAHRSGQGLAAEAERLEKRRK
jgi:acyl-CoA hydrolase